MKEFLSQVDFYGNRLLKVATPVDEAWYGAYKALLKGISDFVNNNIDTVSSWQGTQDGAKEWFEANFEAAMRGEETNGGSGAGGVQ